MTDEELELLNVLANAWNRYLELPIQLPNDRVEFMVIIHNAERMILCREALRQVEKKAREE